MAWYTSPQLNRIADVLFEPLFVALALLALTYALSRRAPRFARACPALALALLSLFASPGIAARLLRFAEKDGVTTLKAGVVYDVVIVLGGGVDAEITAEKGRAELNDAGDRLVAGFDVLRAGQAKVALLTGGLDPGARRGTRSEAMVMADQLRAWGVDEERLAVEERSTTTHEDAVESVRIARQRGWTRALLVTSAAHIPRARACFEHEGLHVDTLAVDFHGPPQERPGRRFLPRASALTDSTSTIRELVGRIVYRARGWTDE